MSWVRVPSPTPDKRGSGSPRSPVFLSIGASPSGKARDFDSLIRWFESSRPSQRFWCRPSAFDIWFDPIAQLAEQLPFKQWVRGSNPRRVTIKAKQYRCRRPEAYGINCFRAFSARKFDDDSIDANHCFPLTGGIRTPSSQWLANPKPCGALFETATFKKGAIFLPIEYTKFGASICWS